MEKPASFQGPAGRRNLLATLGSLTLFTFLASKFTGITTTRRLLAQKKQAIDCAAPPDTRDAITTAHAAPPDAPAVTTAKMLTRDGRLVEVDLSRINPVKKVSNQELRNWIKPNKR